MSATTKQRVPHAGADGLAEVPPGYKRTEVGVIPEDWEAPRLDDDGFVRRVGSGITPTGGQRVYKQSGLPFVRSQNVGWGRLILDDLVFLDHATHSSFPASEILEGDVLLNITGASIGRCAVATAGLAGGNVNQHVCEIRTESGRLDPRFLCSFILSELGQKQIDSFQAGGNRQGLNFGQIRSFLIPLPPPPEQRAIANALSDMDGLLGALEALIAKKRAIKQAAMRQLLTGKTRLPGFTGAWENRRLGDIGQFVKGRGVKRDEAQSGPLACVRYGEIYTTHDDYIREFRSWISHEVAATATRLQFGDLLFAGSGETKEEIGKCVAFVTDAEAYAGGDIVILRPKDVDPLFLGYALNAPYVARQKASLGQGDAVVHISAAALAQVCVVFPSVDEQTAIATVFSDMDAEIAALERRHNKTRAIKHGMMQQLLTGRVRLVEPEVAA